MRKKLLTLLLVLAMTLSLFGGTPAAAAGAGEAAYSVAISEDQVRIVGETAVVSVTVSSSEYGTFNTVDMSFTYDADKLELNTKEIDGCVLRPGSGTLRVLRYGADLPAGTAFTLAFSCIAAGTAQVRIASARVDNSAGAESSDMPPAAVTSDTITVTVTEPPHGHSWGGPAWVWTETGTGFTAKAVFTCSECGERQEVDAEVTARTTDATCTEAGRIVYTASVRFGGQTYTDEKEAEIPALGHDWGPWTVTSEPTETAPGEEAHVCRRCHLTETRPVPPTGGSGAVTYEIYISGTEHGSVTARPRKAAAGEDVILTPVPDEGYELKEIAVTDADGNEIALTKNADGTCSFRMPNGPVTVTATFSPIKNAADRFVDVSRDDWFYDAVDWAAENSFMNGVSSTMFGPGMPMNRGMVVTVLYRMEGEPAAGTKNPFSDIEDGKWYTDAVDWGAENGIILGYPDGAFRPLQEITREQMAAIMMRYAAYKGCDVTARSDFGSFADGDRVSGWAKENVSWAVAAGLIRGRDGNRIAPLEYTTRAEAAMILMRFSERFAD